MDSLKIVMGRSSRDDSLWGLKNRPGGETRRFFETKLTKMEHLSTGESD